MDPYISFALFSFCVLIILHRPNANGWSRLIDGLVLTSFYATVMFPDQLLGAGLLVLGTSTLLVLMLTDIIGKRSRR